MRKPKTIIKPTVSLEVLSQALVDYATHRFQDLREELARVVNSRFDNYTLDDLENIDDVQFQTVFQEIKGLLELERKDKSPALAELLKKRMRKN